MNDDLFSHIENMESFNPSPNEEDLAKGPLPHRMRPEELDELVGHPQVLGVAQPLRRWIEEDQVPSLILWGPPGCGKTTIGHIIARKTKSRFVTLSAVLSGVKEMKQSIEMAKEVFRLSQKKTILFIDEIHRFNQSQQDVLLPHVEDGTITLIGATTENPSFELNTALLSRTRVIRLEPLSHEALKLILKKALEDHQKGLAGLFQLTEEAMDWLVSIHDGDARRLLISLESIALYVDRTAFPLLDLHEIQKILESALAGRPVSYDKNGEDHFNTISALIKSMRKGDPHAALYYLARMLEGGEDPLFIARRMVVFASEDVGNADPRALQIALQVREAVDFIGMPEARISLAQGVTYLAVAPKSRAAYQGIESAIAEVKKTGALPIPLHLRNTGKPSSAPPPSSCLPNPLRELEFYHPIDSGLEIQIRKKLNLTS